MDIFSGQGHAHSTHVSTNSSPVTNSTPKGPLKEYENAPTFHFTGIPNLRKRIESLAKDLAAGRTTEQYLVIRDVTKDHLAQIDDESTGIGRSRKTHYADTNLLIIKVPTLAHESAHLSLSDEVNEKLRGMGIPKRSLCGFGHTTYYGSSSSKEGDSTYKPRCRTRKDDWPVLVVEAAVSETLARLRIDADWWLTNSNGEVKVVVIISIREVQKSIQIEKWCLQLRTPAAPATRANAPISTKIQELTITQPPPIPTPPGDVATYAVTGAPLILEFEKLLLRAPVLPEGDVIFTAEDLQAWADEFWGMIK
jgi:hypothetical protein